MTTGKVLGKPFVLHLLLGAVLAPALVPACLRPVDLQNEEPSHSRAREIMVAQQIQRRGIKDPRVLAAMRKVPRHRFIDQAYQNEAHADSPAPIGHGQTISQPYIVALMTELLELRPSDRVLEIGTGCGYQTAVLAEIAAEVYSIEIVEPLCKEARARLAGFGYKNTSVRCGDGYRGEPDRAPFDAIIVTAAPGHIPQPLLDQLAEGGRMVIPVGDFAQELLLLKKVGGLIEKQAVISVRFVPMTGEAQGR